MIAHPSTTAVAPLFLTPNLSAADPATYNSPPVAPYNATFPINVLCLFFVHNLLEFLIEIIPEDMLLPI